MTTAPISRRRVIAAPIVLAGCGKRPEYFGNATPPQRPVLKFGCPEPDGLDPGAYVGGFELYILPSLFEGLVSYDPYTVEPTAGLATHYQVNADDTRMTFFLRGHPNPRGIRLPRGPDRTPPARWTDGTPITALDFVYSWRRVIDPETASTFAYVLFYVRNARDIRRPSANCKKKVTCIVVAGNEHSATVTGSNRTTAPSSDDYGPCKDRARRRRRGR